jgi:hypothetical protein
MIEGLYRRMIGPVNPREPNQSFKILISIMKIVGVFPPDSDKAWVQNLYALYSVIIRILVLHFFVFFQIVFLMKVSDIKVSLPEFESIKVRFPEFSDSRKWPTLFS